MKIQQLLLVIIAAAAFAVAACNKNGSVNVDTGKLTTAFESASADAKTAADTVATAIKSGAYAGAVTQLKALGDKYKLTPEQQQAVNDLVAQVQKIIADAAAKGAADASKGAADLGKALPK